MVQGPVEVFLAYDAKDEALAAKLEVHLASLMRTDAYFAHRDHLVRGIVITSFAAS
jgi:hypothetical protein